MPAAPLQQLVDELQTALCDNLVSVTLYGPEAKSELSLSSEGAEFPLLIVVGCLDAAALASMAGPVKQWRRLGQPRPLIFTEKRLHQSGDSFSVELLDMKEARRVLFGKDSIIELEIDRMHFQQSLAGNLKRELLTLRSRYLESAESPAELRETLLDSDSHLRLLARAALRLFMPVGPNEHHAVLKALKIHLPLEIEVFLRVDQLRQSSSTDETNHVEIYLAFIEEVEKLIDATDTLMQRRQIPLTHPPFKR